MRGYTVLHSGAEMVLVISLAIVASIRRLGRVPRSAAAALGLVSCSALLIHCWAGQSEGHFHFFVVVSLLILYQDWLPFLIAIGFVVVHHGVLGSALPHELFPGDAAVGRPWTWPFIHGAFILAASAANIVSWRATSSCGATRSRAWPGARSCSTASASASGARIARACTPASSSRPRPLQGPRRLARPRRRRPCPRHGERAPARGGARQRHRRGASAATSSSASARTCATSTRRSSWPSA